MYIEGSEGPESVFWAWVQDGASRVALIAFDALVLTSNSSKPFRRHAWPDMSSMPISASSPCL
jgi:hypothetical protein